MSQSMTKFLFLDWGSLDSENSAVGVCALQCVPESAVCLVLPCLVNLFLRLQRVHFVPLSFSPIPTFLVFHGHHYR